MRLIPHIRTRRWVWLALAIFVAIAWAGSTRFAIAYFADSLPIRAIGIVKGCVAVTWTSDSPTRVPGDGWHFVENGWGLEMLPSFKTTTRSAAWGVWRGAEMPLWPLLLLFSVLALLTFRRAHRLRSPDACPACAYPRAGLPESAPCPECGKS